MAHITSAEIAAKMQSKREIYRFLETEVKCYLSSYETMTIFHLRDLASSRKLRLKADKVKHIAIPQFKTLSIKEIRKFIDEHPMCETILRYFPTDNKEWEKLPRQYVANVAYTVIGQEFQDWMLDRVEQRNEKVKNEKDMLVELDPEILAIFQASTAVSGKYLMIQSSFWTFDTYFRLQSTKASAPTSSKPQQRGDAARHR